MRYENWDVLLFPGISKVPIQEFKTQCFVTRDRESPYLNQTLYHPTSLHPPHGNLGQLPVLTTFIPSLPASSPFRVSIHSWEQPQASRLMESLLRPDDALLFEVRVFVDGLCVAGSVISQRANLPHVIDLSSHVDKSGNQDNLRFPPFHPEILEQRHWDAGDLHGRIRVVIAEGFSRPHRNPPFERVKEIIAFAFQHAPLHVLEYSSIAWPNASMWSREPRLFKYNAASSLSDFKDPEDSHTHSPTRHDAQAPVAAASQISNPPPLNIWRNRNYQGPVPQWQGPQGTYGEPRWAPPEATFADPFIDPYVLEPASRHRGARPSWEDISMPDYVSSSTSSRVISTMTGASYEHSKQSSNVAPIDEEPYGNMVEPRSPLKPLSCGTNAQASAGTTTLPVRTKLSAAAETRTASHAKGESQVSDSVLQEISYTGTGEASGKTTKSNVQPDSAGERGAAIKLHPSPSGPVRSRKEGMTQENKENEEEETPGNESDAETPHIVTVLVAKSFDTPTPTRRRCSVGAKGEEHRNSKRKDPVLFSATQGLSGVEDHVGQAECDCFVDERPAVVSPVAEANEVD